MSLNVKTACLVVVFALSGAPAFAQAVETFVSGTGTGTTCSRTAPCSNLNIAHDATAAGGVITILDRGAAGIAIKKSITVRAVGVVAGGAFTDNVSGNWVDVSAGPNDVVTLDGLRFTGGGITFMSGAHLHVLNSVIGDHRVADQAAIRFQPNGPSKLSIANTIIKNTGNGTGGGVVVNPRPGGSARVNIEHTTINGGAFGIAADGSNSTNGINMTIADSMIGGNSQDGVIATTPAGGAPIGVFLKNTKSVNNAIGVRSLGPNVTVRMDGSSVIGNGTGLSFGSGGALLSFGNNNVEANGSNGSFSGAAALK